MVFVTEDMSGRFRSFEVESKFDDEGVLSLTVPLIIEAHLAQRGWMGCPSKEEPGKYYFEEVRMTNLRKINLGMRLVLDKASHTKFFLKYEGVL